MSAALDLEALADPALYRELQMAYPRGLNFAPVVATAVREIVQVMKDRLQERDSTLRLRLEPPHGEVDSKGRPRPPMRLVLRSGDCFWRISVACHENAAIIQDRVIATAGREDAITRIAAAITAAVKECLGFQNETKRRADRMTSDVA